MILSRTLVAGVALLALVGCASPASPSTPGASGSGAPAASSAGDANVDACLNALKVSDGVGKFIGAVPTGGITQKQFDDTFNNPQAEALAPQFRPSFDKMKAIGKSIIGADQMTSVHKLTDLTTSNEEFGKALTATCKVGGDASGIEPTDTTR